jgi:tRNA threonylcarbamoyl adenosine modification protein (Sua5/YciO/YrdC/YwlC family)
VNVRKCGPGTPSRGEAIAEAISALASGRLVVLPTDTVYGIGATASDPAAVAALLAAKGRGRNLPPPVLIGDPAQLGNLARDISPEAQALAAACWPGALTLVLRANPSLRWDLGDKIGTIAVRVPDNPVARELLLQTGPLAVSSANLSGQAPALTAQAAAAQLGLNAAVYLDAGAAAGGVPSTVVDATSKPPRVLRPGAISLESLRRIVPSIESTAPGPAPPPPPEPPA